MPIAGHYRIDQPSVVSETIDGEAVILDLRIGLYYSIAGIGAAIWNALDGGHAIEAILDRAAVDFPANAPDVRDTITRFVEELIERKLLVPADPPAAAAAAAPCFEGPFVAPVLSTYEDMEDLLLLDPIHDVEDAGWPVRKPADAAD